MLARMNGFVAAQLGLPASQTTLVLDVGCGYGATIRQFLSEYPNASFAGISNNRGQIDTANDWLSKQNLTGRAAFRVADFAATPFSDASFDAAFALESACFADSSPREGDAKQKMLAEVARVLRPDGRFVVVDGFRRQNGPLPYPIAYLYRKCTHAWGMDGLPEIEFFTKTLVNQGFEEVKTVDISWNLAPSLLHIPWCCLKLLAAYFIKKEMDALHYAKALLLTLLLSPFKRYFGYYAVTCRKSSVRLGN